jgi:6-pyruvoyltetrahydropterin/6-carboxytetrahydropterin synthase
MEQHHVRVAGDDLVFSAAHFITLAGGLCERLHGHDYRVAAEVSGPLDENHYVVDFVALREALKAILGELDHRVLLPTEHPAIQVAADDREVTATLADRRWVFPRGDCLLLPMPNTTAELLARHIACRLGAELRLRLAFVPARIRIDLDEGLGQTAICQLGGDD